MKKYKYFATFISGLQEPIESLLKCNIDDCCINLLLDGAVVFETNRSYDQLGMNCFNNIFAIINIKKVNSNSSCLERYIKELIKNKTPSDVIAKNSKKIKTFRIILSSENQLIAINKGIKTQLEKIISQQSKLLLNRSKSDTEFWVLYRSEGYCFFMKRLSKHITYDKLLNKGELHPELSYILNYIAEPSKNDICLDPFCGYGSIPLQRLKHFPTNKFYAFDNDKSVLSIAKLKLKKHINSTCIIKNVNFNSIEEVIDAESIDNIITDPPWGLFENIQNINEFYKNILSTCIKLVKPNGNIVILTAKKAEMLSAINTTKNCSLIKTYNILVSGKKAGVYLIKKTTKSNK